MKIFISCSGEVSTFFGTLLKDWFPHVIQAVEPWVYSEDIKKGTRWFYEIGRKLVEINFGLLCITKSNMNAPWILFEAGALSKVLGQSRVSPLLIDITPNELKGPLAQFQATNLDKFDFNRLVISINEHMDNKKISENQLEIAYEKWWPALDSYIKDARRMAIDEIKESENNYKQDPIKMIEELLSLTRGIVYQLGVKEIIDMNIFKKFIDKHPESGMDYNIRRYLDTLPEEKAIMYLKSMVNIVNMIKETAEWVKVERGPEESESSLF